MSRPHPTRRTLFFGLIAAVCAFALPTFAAPPTLGPGSPAPALDIKAWYKGTPITQLDPKKTYVIDFWATWCGPCISAIPHLTKLARKNPDITFLGVCIWEPNDKDKITKFVAEMGDKMDYTVGWSSDNEGMVLTWMQPAILEFIPSAFIVRNGVIQWIGQPMEIDGVLESIKKGNHDLAKAKVTYAREAEMFHKDIEKQKAFTKIDSLNESGKTAEAKAALDAFAKTYPDETQKVEFMKFGWLAKEDPEAWKAQAKSYANEPMKQEHLGRFALGQAQPGGDRALAEYALTLVLDATERKSLRPLSYAVTYYEQTKEYPKALTILDAIEKLLPTLPEKEQANWQAILKNKRQEFSKASN